MSILINNTSISKVCINTDFYTCRTMLSGVVNLVESTLYKILKKILDEDELKLLEEDKLIQYEGRSGEDKQIFNEIVQR